MGVVARGSTNLSPMVHHPLVRTALQRMDQQPVDELSVEQLLNDLVISRSTLDRAFRKTIGRTAYEEIRQRRLHLARELLGVGSQETGGKHRLGLVQAGAERLFEPRPG